MSDIGIESPAADPAFAAAPAVEVTPAAPAPETPAPEAAPEAPEDLSKFGEHADYIKELRAESAARRVAAKKYEDALKGYTPEEQEVWLGLQQELVNDPRSAAAKFQQIAKEILGADEPATPAVPETDLPTDKPLTQADITKILADRDAKTQADQDLAAATTKVVTEAEDLGYKQGSAEWRELMFLARYETDGDLAKAHEKRETRDAAAVEAYLAKKAGQGGIPVSHGAGDTPSQTAAITTFEGAREALRARLNAQ